MAISSGKKKIYVVIGANYGDEGKGVMTDYLTRLSNETDGFDPNHKCLNVLTNGGSQRGHTVITPNRERHIFRHFGSGTFAGADTYIPQTFIANPMNFCNEMWNSTFPTSRKVYIHPQCMVSTPYDMMANQIIEDARGDQRHSSCGVGIWETIYRGGITAEKLFSMSDRETESYLKTVREYYMDKRFKEKGIQFPDKWRWLFFSEPLMKAYIDSIGTMREMTMMFGSIVLHDMRNSVIFENGQGLCLDQSGDYLTVYEGHLSTPSYTGLRIPSEMIHKEFTDDEVDVTVVYVTRTYLTRHGKGWLPHPMTAEEAYDLGIRPDWTNGWNHYQGDFRYAHLNVKALNRRISQDFEKYSGKGWKKQVAVTHLDEIPIEAVSGIEDVAYLVRNGTVTALTDRTSVE